MQRSNTFMCSPKISWEQKMQDFICQWKAGTKTNRKEVAYYKKAHLTFTVCLRCFSFSVCRSLRVRNPFATAVILSNFICMSGVKTLKKKPKLFIKKQELWIIYQITSIKWCKFSSRKKAVDKALSGLKIPTII